MRNTLIEAVESEYKKDNIPEFRAGDTVSVDFRIVEGNKERIQSFQGLVIRINNNGLNTTFTVRKVVGDIGVERIFPIHSPRIEAIKVIRRGRVRRAKLYYIRERRGKAARIKERRKGF
jgi:large subunit ribosomal protein L19